MKICVAIVGPTASGKTSFAIQLASHMQGEIVCMDSATVYRGFDIGTAKPTAEEKEKVPHHLIDILDPKEPFSAGHFVEHAGSVITEIQSRGKLPILVGGTYFYLRALQNGMYPTPIIPAELVEDVEREYFEDDALDTPRMHADLKKLDPKSAKNIHPNDRYRLLRALTILRATNEKPSSLKPEPISETNKDRVWMKYAICQSRHSLNQSIVRRTERIIQSGLVEETRKLMEHFPQSRALQSIGYAESVAFLEKRLTEKQLRNEIIEKTRQLAKRQTTWLRSDAEIRYIDFRDMERVQLEISNLKVALGENEQ